jgi:hypothetical protein
MCFQVSGYATNQELRHRWFHTAVPVTSDNTLHGCCGPTICDQLILIGEVLRGKL